MPLKVPQTTNPVLWLGLRLLLGLFLEFKADVAYDWRMIQPELKGVEVEGHFPPNLKIPSLNGFADWAFQVMMLGR